MSVCLYTWPANGEAVCIWRIWLWNVFHVCVCVVAVTVFFAMRGKTTTASVLAMCVEYTHWKLQRCLARSECVYPWWWLRYNNVWLYQTVSMIVLGRVCALCGCVYAIVTKTVFGSTCESALQIWQSCFLFFTKCVYLYLAVFVCVWKWLQ